MQTVLTPISIGELVDKITILEIKREKFTDPVKKQNVTHELEYLLKIYNSIEHDLSRLKSDLKNINMVIWDIENRKRDKERTKKFDDEFIQLARNVYIYNDQRADVKRIINMQTKSDIIEEKEHTFKKALFLGHLGMGDHILCNGLIRTLSEKYDEVTVCAAMNNFNNAGMMFTDKRNVIILPLENDHCVNLTSSRFNPEMFKNNVNGHGYDLYMAGHHKSVQELPYSFYDHVGIEREIFWKNFYLPELQESKELFKMLNNTPYVFIHNTSSDMHVDVNSIKSLLDINDDILIVNPCVNSYSFDHKYYNLAERFLNHPLFHYVDIIINASQVLLTDSSFFCMSINLEIKTEKCLYLPRPPSTWFDNLYTDSSFKSVSNNRRVFKKVNVQEHNLVFVKVVV